MNELLQAAKAVIRQHVTHGKIRRLDVNNLRDAVEQAEKQKDFDQAIDAGDNVLINEQAALLRECRKALDDLLTQQPMWAAKVCGTDTLGNLKAQLYDYRPQGVFGESMSELLQAAWGNSFFDELKNREADSALWTTAQLSEQKRIISIIQQTCKDKDTLNKILEQI